MTAPIPRAAATGPPDVATLRRWLGRLDAPDQLAVPELIALLRAHDRLPASSSPLAVGQAAALLLTEAIERLRLPTTAPRHQQLPYQVLKTCFLDRTKRFKAGIHLGISERQVTRERTRALRLLGAELVTPRLDAQRADRAQPVPRIVGYLPRAGYDRQLADLVAEHGLVHVDGPRGVGKTCLVAEYVAIATPESPVVWFQLREGLNDTLAAFLLDLVETLRGQLAADRSDALTEALTQHDPGVASRVALHALTGVAVLLVIDDYHLAEGDRQLTGFVEEATSRVPGLTVVTISRRRERADAAGAVLHVAPLEPDETAALLGHLRIDADPTLVETVHRWTGGLPQLIKFAASWLKTATADEIARGTGSLMEVDDVQEFLLDNITDLIDPEDRHVLSAASIFRDRFNDDALAYVAERSRGQVLDTSRRLVRYYLATRGHDGEVAFFHASVRDYINARLRPSDRARFHKRAAIWYERHGDPDEARHHEGAQEA
ncbi:MAG: serine/threonine-protein kinase PknK [Frankiaceae bacterium]|jgi:ATP/maltotriose-dependent transcriptional regulator MalT|nr:serine/threonine-protein kinase PknK [Frankiaceae bacterium]